jgi:hypothetical protein
LATSVPAKPTEKQHQGQQQGGIHPAGQEQPEGHLGPQVLAHHPVHEAVELGGKILEGPPPRPYREGRPIVQGVHGQIALHDQRLSGPHPLDAPHQGVRARAVAVGQILGQGFGHQFRCRALGQQRLQFRAEQHPVRPPEHIQRLDAQPVAGQDQAPLAPVIQSEGKHAVQVPQAVQAPSRIGPENGFAVGMSGETVAETGEFLVEFQGVVDFAVGDQNQAQGLIGDGLVAAGEVDDREPVVSQSHRPLDEQAVMVRAAVGEAPGPVPQALGLHRRAGGKNSSNAAH